MRRPASAKARTRANHRDHVAHPLQRVRVATRVAMRPTAFSRTGDQDHGVDRVAAWGGR
jgi:hypothetical protein